MRRILRGQVVVEATLRGDEVLMVRRFVEDHGTPLWSGWTAFFPVARFLVWRRKRTQVIRPTFL